MNIKKLPLPGLLLVGVPLYRDERGHFSERFHARRFESLGLPSGFTQDNHSYSRPGVLRGLHYQHRPPQGKLVGVVRGRIWDVAVDIRFGSPTFGKHYAVELNDRQGQLLWIPAGFAHGFCVLGDEAADVLYKADACYDAEGEGGICWNDSNLAIPWPIRNPVVSARDQWLGSFRSYENAPAFWASAESNATEPLEQILTS